MIVALWGKRAASPIQAVYLGWPLGSTLAPLIAYPFVSQDSENDNNTTSGLMDTFLESFRDYADDSEIEKAFWIIGLVSLTIGVLFLVYQMAGMPTVGSTSEKSERNDLTLRQVMSPSFWSPGRPCFGVVIVGIFILYYCFQAGTTMGPDRYHALYAVESNFTTEQEATLLSASINLSSTFGRVFVLFIGALIPPTILLLVFGCVLVVALFTLIFWGLQNVTVYWVCLCIYGFFVSPLYPGMYAWANTFIVLYAVIFGIMQAFVSLVRAALTFMYGYSYTELGRESVFYISFIFAGALGLTIILMNVYAIPHGTRFRKDNKTEKELELDVSNVYVNLDTVFTKL